MIRRVSKQKGLQLYPRVILNKSAPKMRLNMSEKQRHTLLTTMLSALIKEERIKTTTAKAKFIQFYADRVIQLAKNPTEENYNLAKSLLRDHAVVMPKLFGLLGARYENYPGHSFTNVLLNGHRDYKKTTQGPTQYFDAAPMAILEFSGGKKSISYLLAKGTLGVYKQKLSEIKDLLYDNEHVELVNPETYEPYTHVKTIEKQLPITLLKRYRKQEYDFNTMVTKYETLLETVDSANLTEKTYLLKRLPEIQQAFDLRLKKKDIPQTYKESLKWLGYEIVKDRIRIARTPSNTVDKSPVEDNEALASPTLKIDTPVISETVETVAEVQKPVSVMSKIFSKWRK